MPQPQLLPLPRSSSEPVSDEARSLSAFLAGAKLLVHEAVLRLGGYEEVADLAEAEDDDLVEMGLKKPEVKRLRRYLAEVLEGAT